MKDKLILESSDNHRYYDYLEEYSAYSVISMVMHGEALWTPLISPPMYQKALSEFTQYGKLIKFPSKYVYQWMGIIMKNTAILRTCTEIAGHSDYYPFEDIYDYFFNDEGVDENGKTFEEWCEENGQDPSNEYGSMTEYLEEVGFFKGLVLPDGSDAWSDFGIEPIEELIGKYDENKEPEEVLVLINKILDVMHFRGDLSSMFIEGGKKTLTRISYNEALKRKKKIIVSESQAKNLLFERMSSEVYHYTSLKNILKIAEEDTIYLQSSLSGLANTSNKNELFYLSTTRVKNQSFGYSSKFTNHSARITFDGDKLNQVFKGGAYNYWGDWGKMQYLKNDNEFTKSKQAHTDDEAEDRLYSNEPSIPYAHRFIKRIDVIFHGKDNINGNEDSTYKLNLLNVHNLLMSSYNRFVFVYDNLNDFNKQSDNTINKQLMDNYDNMYVGSYEYKSNSPNADTVALVLSAILNGESENLQKDSAMLLKQYGLETYSKSGILKRNKYLEYPYSFDFKRIAEELSHQLNDLSSNPSKEKAKLLKMLSDYFRKNKLKTYKDFIRHKQFTVKRPIDYYKITDLIERGYLDKTKTIDAILIRDKETYNDIVITDPKSFKIRSLGEDMDYIADNFISWTEDNMKSDNSYSYEKYIKNVFKKDPSLQQLIDMLVKLGYQQNNISEMLSSILGTIVKFRTLGVYDIDKYKIMQNAIGREDYNFTEFIKLFRR